MALNTRNRLVDRIITASARAVLAGRPVFVTLSAHASPDIDPLAAAIEAGGPYAYWEQPSRGFALSGLGATFVFTAPGENRFSAAAHMLRDLRARTLQESWDGADRSPFLIGGFSFNEVVNLPQDRWRGFPSGRLVLPELTFIRREGEAVWVAARQITDDESPSEAADALIGCLHEAQKLGRHAPQPTSSNHQAVKNLRLRDNSFLAKATAAIKEISGQALSKVVLARRLEIKHVPDSGVFLVSLRERFPECAVFAFASTEGLFCGATPELLAQVKGVSVSTIALAGTAPRGVDPTMDGIIAERLRRDPKEAEEHDLVISEIRRRLDKGGFVLDPPAPTEVMKLPGLQHLATPITATAPVGTNVLGMVGVLHPTPAVAGIPTEVAVEWIASQEGFDRGWYAGPVGFCDLSGQGEFHVALRSALINKKGSTLFAGAGIVGASRPEQELAETELKLGALLPLLLGS